MLETGEEFYASKWKKSTQNLSIRVWSTVLDTILTLFSCCFEIYAWHSTDIQIADGYNWLIVYMIINQQAINYYKTDDMTAVLGSNGWG